MGRIISNETRLPKRNVEIGTIGAKLDDFDFDLPIQVQSFKLKVPGQPTVVVQGTKMNAQVFRRPSAVWLRQRLAQSSVSSSFHPRTFASAAQPSYADSVASASPTSDIPTSATPHPLYPTLFTPLTLPNGRLVANRVLMGSMHSGLEGTSMPSWMEKLLMIGENDAHDHHSLDRMATYFQRRAQGGVGLMVTGGIAPNHQGWVGPYAAQLTTPEEMERHKVVTEAVHDVQIPIFGTDTATAPLICLQILHSGRYAYHPWAVSASATKSPISPFPAKELSKKDIQQTVNDFVNTSVLAQQAGYDGVEIMGSEGYLISQFLSPHTNHRTDEYGGSAFENRARFPLEIVNAVRKATGNDFVIIFRISLLDLVDGGMTWEEAVELAQMLQSAGVTVLNTGIGWHESRVPTIATNVPRGAFAFCTKKLRQIHNQEQQQDRPCAPQSGQLFAHAFALTGGSEFRINPRHDRDNGHEAQNRQNTGQEPGDKQITN